MIEWHDYSTGTKTTTLYRYDGQNVVVELVQGPSDPWPPGLSRSYVNGSTYIDERVLVADASGTEHYYLLKELYSVAGLADEDGEMAEAYTYDAYGKPYIYTTQRVNCDVYGDVDGDCDVDIADFEVLQICYGSGAVPADCPAGAVDKLDSDDDGDVDSVDLGAFMAAATGPGFGWIADGDWNADNMIDDIDCAAFVDICYSGPGGGMNTNGCIVFDFDGDNDVDIHDYAGLAALKDAGNSNTVIDLTSIASSSLNQHFFTGQPRFDATGYGYRDRDLKAHLGIFHQRDPNGSFSWPVWGVFNASGFVLRSWSITPGDEYRDGMHLYNYVSGNPQNSTDPSGRCRVGSQRTVATQVTFHEPSNIKFLGSHVERTSSRKWHAVTGNTVTDSYRCFCKCSGCATIAVQKQQCQQHEVVAIQPGFFSVLKTVGKWTNIGDSRSYKGNVTVTFPAPIPPAVWTERFGGLMDVKPEDHSSSEPQPPIDVAAMKESIDKQNEFDDFYLTFNANCLMTCKNVCKSRNGKCASCAGP